MEQMKYSPRWAPTNTIPRSADHDNPHSGTGVYRPSEILRTPPPESRTYNHAERGSHNSGSWLPMTASDPPFGDHAIAHTKGRFSDHETGSPSGRATTLTCVWEVMSRSSISSERKASELPSGDHFGDQLSPSPSVIWRAPPDSRSTTNNCRNASPVNPRPSKR